MRKLDIRPTYNVAAGGISEFMGDVSRMMPWALQRMSDADIAERTEEIPGTGGVRTYTSHGGRVRSFFRVEGDTIVMLDIVERV